MICNKNITEALSMPDFRSGRIVGKSLVIIAVFALLHVLNRIHCDPSSNSVYVESLTKGGRQKRNTVNSSSSVFTLTPNKTNRFMVIEATDFVCGKYGFCNQNLSRSEELCSFECDKVTCMCDGGCRFYGDCSPDMLFGSARNHSYYPSPVVTCLQGNFTRWANYSSIWMVDRCLATSSLDVVGKCESPDITDQQQATPVSTVSDHVTYRNVFCARCHGVKDFQTWRHRVACVNATMLKGAKSRTELWTKVVNSENCEIESLHPNDVIIRECRGETVDTCNVTGSWQKFSQAVASLCGLYRHTVDYFGRKSGYKSYRNVFCAICNGVDLDRNELCDRHKSLDKPYPLSVLLDFNPASDISPETETELPLPTQRSCDSWKIFDPIYAECRPVVCSDGRIYDQDSCVIPYTSLNGLGFKLDVLLKASNRTLKMDNSELGIQYLDKMKTALAKFRPFVVYKYSMKYLGERLGLIMPPPNLPTSSADPSVIPTDLLVISRNLMAVAAYVEAQIITKSALPVPEFQADLRHFLSEEKTFLGDEGNFTLLSSLVTCTDVESSYSAVSGFSQTASLSDLDNSCLERDCMGNTVFYRLSLECPYIEYNISDPRNFTFDPDQRSFVVLNQTYLLKSEEYMLCDDLLKICASVIKNLSSTLNRSQRGSNSPSRPSDPAMEVVSLVCISLSLAGLFFTFLTYSLVPLLRNLPGLNTMALVFSLFWAQLVFLVGSNRTDNQVVCQALGISIHYLWLLTFSWMAVSAYHVYVVFCQFHSRDHGVAGKRLRFVKYCAFSGLAPAAVVCACVAYYTFETKRNDIGYGGEVCFLKRTFAIGVFFVGPLVAMLVMNGVFFVRTVLAIRRVPKMADVSNKTNRRHLYVYIKLSLLFGFSWAFGILAAIFRSDVLWYTFIVLTGSQGVLLFAAYCANKRTSEMVKSSFSDRSRTSVSSRGEMTGNAKIHSVFRQKTQCHETIGKKY